MVRLGLNWGLFANEMHLIMRQEAESSASFLEDLSEIAKIAMFCESIVRTDREHLSFVGVFWERSTGGEVWEFRQTCLRQTEFSECECCKVSLWIFGLSVLRDFPNPQWPRH
jgi:hypothetical protein